MSSIVIKGNTSGQVEIAAPDVAGSTTLTLPTGTGNFITSDSNGDVTISLIPSTTDNYDLGSASKVWRNIYTGDLNLSNEAKEQGNSVDGTKGSWTIQEGADNLFLVNNK